MTQQGEINAKKSNVEMTAKINGKKSNIDMNAKINAKNLNSEFKWTGRQIGKTPLDPVQAGWIFLFSYAAGVMLPDFASWQDGKGNGVLVLFLFYVLFGQVGLNLLPGVGWSKWRGLSLRRTLRLNPVPWSVLGLGIAVYVVSQIPLLFVHQLTELILSVVGDTYKVSEYPIADNIGALLLLILSIGIIAPICEEMLFRGVLLTGYERRGTIFAAVMSSALFALFHDNPYRLLELFIAAFVSSIIVLYARSIWPGIAVHLATNIAYVVGSYVRGGDLVEGASSGGGRIDVWLLAATGAASVLAVYVCLRLLKLMKRRMDASGISSSSNKLVQRGEEDESVINERENRSWGWLIPIGLAVVVFVAKAMV
ncbi:type II CAAX endopeptidase family protein [Paenibacillus kobensis]|uniref:type II CAAX endopeptidase family protein n=1 Tax=Paenibacillus kobensis TaxID=59841 RepID=UPI000FD8BCB2|nr:type II CAAX endopeptidase family protein [Paenibacillus kobensis]